jgi:hypothetical protein
MRFGSNCCNAMPELPCKHSTPLLRTAEALCCGAQEWLCKGCHRLHPASPELKRKPCGGGKRARRPAAKAGASDPEVTTCALCGAWACARCCGAAGAQWRKVLCGNAQYCGEQCDALAEAMRGMCLRLACAWQSCSNAPHRTL